MRTWREVILKPEAITHPNRIGWDGDDDPQNPLNWSERRKMGLVILIATITLVMNLASSMFAPGVPELMAEFRSQSTELAAFTVSVYVLGFALAPLVIGPLSELYVACALSNILPMFIVFRFLAGCADSAPLSLGGGSITDFTVQEQRGGAAMAIFSNGPILGPVIAPVIGGFVAQSLGWRWIFWILAIGVGAITIVSLLFMKETYAPILLETKVKRLRKEIGNTKLISIHDNGRTPSHLSRTAIVRPLKMFFLQPIVLLMSLYTALIFGYLFLLFTTFTEVFEEQYYFSGRIVGLSYLGLGIGMIFGLVGFSALSDRVLKRLSTSSDGEMKPEYRLPMMFYCSLILPIGFFWYGWGAEVHKHWIVPMLETGAVGIGILCIFLPTQIYLAFPIYAASVLAANTVLRCLFGGVLRLAGEAMYKSLGLGCGNSVLAFVAMGFCPVPWLFYRYVEQIRKKFEIEL